MKITYYGHSAIGLDIQGKKIIVDPFISGNPLNDRIDIDQLEADYIMITHAHYDHIMDVESIASRTGATLISNHEIIVYFQALDLMGHEMNIGGSWEFDFGKVYMVFATHSSSFPDGKYGGNPAGFVIESKGKTLYIAGDTALTQEMKLLPLFHKIDLAILPIGGNFTMNVEQAAVASDFIDCNRIMGMHYDTIDFIKINHQKARDTFAAKNKELILLEIGESLKI